MSDEREKRLESDEPELEDTEVEAHKRMPAASDETSAEEGEDVEAHVKLRDKYDRA